MWSSRPRPAESESAGVRLYSISVKEVAVVAKVEGVVVMWLNSTGTSQETVAEYHTVLHNKPNTTLDPY